MLPSAQFSCLSLHCLSLISTTHLLPAGHVLKKKSRRSLPDSDLRKQHRLSAVQVRDGLNSTWGHTACWKKVEFNFHFFRSYRVTWAKDKWKWLQWEFTLFVCYSVSHRDAAVGECSFNLTVLDCLQGLRKVHSTHEKITIISSKHTGSGSTTTVSNRVLYGGKIPSYSHNEWSLVPVEVKGHPSHCACVILMKV